MPLHIPSAARRPIALRLSVGAALLLLALGLGIIFFSDYRYRDEKRLEAETQAKVVAASLVASIDFQDRQSASEYLVALRANPRIATVVVQNHDGARFVAYERPGVGAAGGTTLATAPIMRGSEKIGTVTLTETIDPLWRRLSRYSSIFLLIVVAALLVGVFALGQAALHRANEALSQRADALAAANGALEREMEERANAEDQLRQSQKMQALGQLTGGIAHDFNNLLTVIRGTADLLCRPNLEESRRVRYAESIAQTADRAATLTSQLLAFSRRQSLQPKVLDVNERLEEMRRMFERVLGAQYTVITDLGADLCPVEVDPTQLEVAILNILVNARDAMGDGGTLTIVTRSWQRGPESGQASGDTDPGFVAVSVTDTGCGMDADTVARATEPFFTTKTVGKGTGLGLSQVYGFAAQSGGEVRIESAIGEGTTIQLILPCTVKDCDPIEAAPATAAGNWRATILFVEDNAELAAFAKTLLEELGHEVLYAPTGERALELAAEDRPFDLLFTDIVMPGIGGLDLAREVQKLRPATPILLATGYSERLNEDGAGGLPVLYKPYSLDELARAIERARVTGA